MLLAPTVIASGKPISVTASLPKATFLNIDGEIRILGDEQEQFAGLSAGDGDGGEENPLCKTGKGVTDVRALFELRGGKGGIGVLMEGGCVTTITPARDGGRAMERHRIREDRMVERLAFGLHPPRVLVVARHRPDTVLAFASWEVFLVWLKGGEIDEANMGSTKLESVILELVGNLEGFTVMCEGGQVYALVPTAAVTPQAADRSTESAPLAVDAKRMESTNAPPSPHDNGAEAAEEEPEISAFLSDTPSSSTVSKTQSTAVAFGAKAVALLAKATRITTHPLARITGIVTNDGSAYLLSSQASTSKPSNSPTLPSLSSLQDPQPIALPSSHHGDSNKHRTKITSLAIGQLHALVLTEEGRVWSAGDGKQGQLGIGPKVRDMRATGRGGVEFHAMDDEPLEWAEEWQEVDVEKVREVWAGGETSFFLVE